MPEAINFADRVTSLLSDASVNEERVLKLVCEIRSAREMTPDTIRRIRLWMQTNKLLNAREEDPYQTWVATVYSKIQRELSSQYD